MIKEMFKKNGVDSTMKTLLKWFLIIIALIMFLPQILRLFYKFNKLQKDVQENAVKGKLTSTKHSAYQIAFNIYDSIWQSYFGLVCDADRACKELYKCNHSDVKLLREMYNEIHDKSKWTTGYQAIILSQGFDEDFQKYCKKSKLYEQYNLKYFFA